jgi:hypothetical protein
MPLPVRGYAHKRSCWTIVIRPRSHPEVVGSG